MYAIKFANGSYYTGRVNSDAEPNAWQGTKEQAFPYHTYHAATVKMNSFSIFRGSTVVEVPPMPDPVKPNWC